jgi:hypothetical protein
VGTKTVGVWDCRHELVEWFFVLAAAAYNLIRIPKILDAAGLQRRARRINLDCLLH